MRTTLFAVALLCLTPLAHADRIEVDAAGGADFLTLTDAVAAASDGDLIVIHKGDYFEPARVVVDGISLEIVGERIGPGTTTIHGGLEVKNLALTQSVLIVNMTLQGADSTETTPAGAGLVLTDNLGTVRVQRATLEGGYAAEPEFGVGGAGLVSWHSRDVTLVDCDVNGGEGTFSPHIGIPTGDGGPGAETTAGAMTLLSSSVRGGDGGSDAPGGWGIGGLGGVGLANHGTAMFLSRSLIRGGDGGWAITGGNGGTGIWLTTPTPVFAVGGLTYAGGDGGMSDNNDPGVHGTHLVDPFDAYSTQGFGPHRDFWVGSPVHEGQTTILHFKGQLGDTALLLVSLESDFLLLPSYRGVLGVAPPLLRQPLLVSFTNELDVVVFGPELGPGVEALNVHVQAAYTGPGGTTLEQPYVVTFLDGAP